MRRAMSCDGTLTAPLRPHYTSVMDFETIRFERADGVATITLHRPERLNAWTPVMGRELIDAFRDADRDRAVRAIILTGAGRAFCAGADMDFFAGQIRGGGGTGAGGRRRTGPRRGVSRPDAAALEAHDRRDQRLRARRRLHDDAALRRPSRRRRRRRWDSSSRAWA